MQKGGTRTLGPEAGKEGRNGPAVLLLKNFSQAALASEIILDSVLMVKSPEADHFFPIRKCGQSQQSADLILWLSLFICRKIEQSACD